MLAGMSKDAGLFVVFDGGEGCGKTTQARLLAEHLRGLGRRVHVLRDPGTTRVGELIRGILLNPDHTELGMRCEMLLYMAARAQMMHETILPLLANGDVVICDRFVSSTLAYQLGGDRLTAEDIRAVAGIAISDRFPDLTIILDIPVGKARRKPNPDRIEQRPPEYHETVRQRFLEQARSDPGHYRVINADRGLAEVGADVVAAVLG
jgi:dTMP kinase